MLRVLLRTDSIMQLAIYDHFPHRARSAAVSRSDSADGLARDFVCVAAAAAAAANFI